MPEQDIHVNGSIIQDRRAIMAKIRGLQKAEVRFKKYEPHPSMNRTQEELDFINSSEWHDVCMITHFENLSSVVLSFKDGVIAVFPDECEEIEFRYTKLEDKL